MAEEEYRSKERTEHLFSADLVSKNESQRWSLEGISTVLKSYETAGEAASLFLGEAEDTRQSHTLVHTYFPKRGIPCRLGD